MNPKLQIFLKAFFIQGGIFTLLMMGWDYFKDADFNVFKILLRFFLFGVTMGFYAVYQYNKKEK